MSIRKGDIIKLSIDRMAHGGQGLARCNGMVVFVRGGIPGDRVSAQVFRRKKDYAEARIIELLSPSSDRDPAPCPYYGFCGGCQWQHVKYDRQLHYKKELVEEAITRIGTLPGVLVHDVIPSEKPYAYRNKMEFSFSDLRWLPPGHAGPDPSGGAFALGLHVPGTFSKVLDIHACLLQYETGNPILREVKGYVRHSGLPVYGLKSHMGFWRFLVLRHGLAGDEWMVNLITSEERPDAMDSLTEILSRCFPNIKTVVNTINSRKAAIATGEREIILTGMGYIYDRVGPFTFQVSANSFFQTNSLGAEKLYTVIRDYAELRDSDTVLDLYSGTGTIPVFLSRGSKSVIGMELTESAVLDAQENCRINGIENCWFIQGDIGKELSRLRLKPDVLIIDPPRTGMHKDILAGVMEMAVSRVIYVSCNPATLARDLAVMGRDYEVLGIQPVDMFPQTYHIESVAKLALRKKC